MSDLFDALAPIAHHLSFRGFHPSWWSPSHITINHIPTTVYLHTVSFPMMVDAESRVTVYYAHYLSKHDETYFTLYYFSNGIAAISHPDGQVEIKIIYHRDFESYLDQCAPRDPIIKFLENIHGPHFFDPGQIKIEVIPPYYRLLLNRLCEKFPNPDLRVVTNYYLSLFITEDKPHAG